MYLLVVILILIISVLLGLIVLVQNSKGGGLVSNFGGANQMMGVRQTTDFLEKATWTMGAILVVLCLVSSIAIPKNTSTSGELSPGNLEQPALNQNFGGSQTGDITSGDQSGTSADAPTDAPADASGETSAE